MTGTRTDAPTPEPRTDERANARADLTYHPDGEPAATCEYCGRPFARERYLHLHRGLAHEDEITEGEREAFEAAHESEDEELRRFRLKALIALVLVYFGMLMVYAVVTA